MSRQLVKKMVTDSIPARCLAYKDRIWEVNVSKVRVSHKSEMAGLFYRGDTIINKHFIFVSILRYKYTYT